MSQKNREKPNTHNCPDRRHCQTPLKLGFTHAYSTMSSRGLAHLLDYWNVWGQVRSTQPTRWGIVFSASEVLGKTGRKIEERLRTLLAMQHKLSKSQYN